MTISSVTAALQLPTDARVDQRVPKKLLVENGAPTAADKRQINDGIEELHWVAALKPTTIGVPAFRDESREYIEVAILQAYLRTNAKVLRLTELIHRAVPYPMFLIMHTPLGINLSLCHLRWSQGQSEQTVLDGTLRRLSLDLESPSCVQFLNSLEIAAQPRQNLFAFYEGWMRCFDAYAAAQVTSHFTLCESVVEYDARRMALVEHDRIQREVVSLRACAVKESQINRRVELNLQIKHLELRLSQILQSL